MATPAATWEVFLGGAYKPYDDPALCTQGLAMSVPPGVVPPATNTLRQYIFPHLARYAFNGRTPPTCDLTRWSTEAGVLLLNATMQSNGVTAAKWKPFLKAVIAKICAASTTPVGFIFMGTDAKKLAGAVTAALVVVQCDFPGQWTGGAAALDTARPFQAIDNALQAAGAPRIQWDVLVR